MSILGCGLTTLDLSPFIRTFLQAFNAHHGLLKFSAALTGMTAAILVTTGKLMQTRSQKWFLGSVAESLARLQYPLVLVVPDTE